MFRAFDNFRLIDIFSYKVCSDVLVCVFLKIKLVFIIRDWNSKSYLIFFAIVSYFSLQRDRSRNIAYIIFGLIYIIRVWMTNTDVN